MTHKRLPILMPAVLSLAALLSACDAGGRPPTAASPPPPANAPDNATYTLSGAISEATASGPVPVESAQVEEASTHQITRTDADGFYTIPGLRATSSTVTVTKSGYVNTTRTVVITGDTRLDLRLNRTGPYTLSGIVFEVVSEGRVPIEGVQVYCDSCGSPEGHTFANTDSNGFYSFSWTNNGPNPLFVTKAGYEIVDPTGTLRDAYGRVKVDVAGDTRFDVELARR